MKVAVYPGSFNPWHEGHQDVLDKALAVFDIVVIAIGVNPEKPRHKAEEIQEELIEKFKGKPIEVITYDGLLKDLCAGAGYDVIIKGLRNAMDLEYERTQQYWNEDLGLELPIFYVISDRSLVHISSSAIRMLSRVK